MIRRLISAVNTEKEPVLKERQPRTNPLLDKISLPKLKIEGLIGEPNFRVYGGIDLNPANMDLQIKRDGRGVPLPLIQQDMAQLSRIEGFEPRIVEIRAVTSLPFLSELQTP